MRTKPLYYLAAALTLVLLLAGGHVHSADSTYDPKGSVNTLEPTEPATRKSGSPAADSVKPFKTSNWSPAASTVALPSHCVFDDTLPGCPGYVGEPDGTGGSGGGGGEPPPTSPPPPVTTTCPNPRPMQECNYIGGGWECFEKGGARKIYHCH